MASITTKGIVLRCANYRDHDKMLTVLSPEYGRLDVLSRGCRRPKSSLLASSELFVCCEMVLFRAGDKYTLTSSVLEDSFFPLRLDSYRLTCASYIAALCSETVQPGENAEAYYSMILKGLYYLAYDPEADPLSTVCAFLLCFSDIMGYRPTFSRCAHCREPVDLSGSAQMDITAGGFCCDACSSYSTYRINHEQIVWMSETLRKGFSVQKDKDAGTLFEVLRRYVESRIEKPIKVSRLLP